MSKYQTSSRPLTHLREGDKQWLYPRHQLREGVVGEDILASEVLAIAVVNGTVVIATLTKVHHQWHRDVRQAALLGNYLMCSPKVQTLETVASILLMNFFSASKQPLAIWMHSALRWATSERAPNQLNPLANSRNKWELIRHNRARGCSFLISLLS